MCPGQAQRAFGGAPQSTHPEGLEAARVGQQRGPVAAQRAPLVLKRRERVAPQQADRRAVGYLARPRAVPDVLRGIPEYSEAKWLSDKQEQHAIANALETNIALQ